MTSFSNSPNNSDRGSHSNLSLIRDKTIEAFLEAISDQLLGSSRNNRLYNQRVRGAKDVAVIDEVSSNIFKFLVEQRHSLQFSSMGEFEALFSDDYYPLPESSNLPEHTDLILQTAYKPNELQRRLLNTRSEAREHLAHEGVFSSYLALGSLKWKDSKDRNRISPLILVPVIIDRVDKNSPFFISYTGMNIESNNVLRKFLFDEHKIEVPIYIGEKLSSYFEKVGKVISSEMILTPNHLNFSTYRFDGLRMQQDLDPKSWPIDKQPKDHLLISALFNGSFIKTPLDYSFENQKYLYSLSPLNYAQSKVLAAGSQNLAVLLEGPPGTGKSFVQVNYAISKVAEGNTHFVVSEKDEALKPISEILAKYDLSHLALRLRGDELKTSTLINKLREVLTLTRPIPYSREGAIRERELAEASLNKYHETVHDNFRQFGLSPIEIANRFLKLKSNKSVNKDLILPPDYPLDNLSETIIWANNVSSILQILGEPSKHPFYGSNLSVYALTNRDALNSLLKEKAKIIDDLYKAIDSLALELKLKKIPKGSEINKLISALEAINNVQNLKPYIDLCEVTNSIWRENKAKIFEFTSAGKEYQKLCKSNSNLNFDVDLDMNFIKNALNNAPKLFPSFRDENYNNALTVLKNFYKNSRIPLSELQIFDDLAKYTRAKELEKKLSSLPEMIKKEVAGFIDEDLLLSNFKSLEDITKFINKFNESFGEELSRELLNSGVFNNLCKVDLGSLSDLNKAKDKALEVIAKNLKLTKEEKENISNLAPKDILNRIKAIFNEDSDLPLWVELQSLLSERDEIDNGVAREVVENWSLGTKDFGLAFNFSLFKNALSQILNSEEVKALDSNNFEVQRKLFSEADKRLLQINAIDLAVKHWDAMPRKAIGGMYEKLKKLIQKKRYPPLRQVIEEFAPVLSRIFRIYLTNPAACAEVFSPHANFGKVSLACDEISQLYYSNIIGAILRAETLFGSGDEKQMPPEINFTKVQNVNVNVGFSERGFRSDQSFLEVASGTGISQYELDMHFRSLKPDLIEISRRFNYPNLETFPSPDNTPGLFYEHLENARYEKVGKNGPRINIKEAEVLAKRVIEEIEKGAKDSIGVIVMNENQAEEVLRQIEILREENNNPVIESYFKSELGKKFFIAPINKVQGMERDIIFTGTTFAPDSSGKFSLKLGPLIQEGGEKRLNVMGTRAKKKMYYISSIYPEKHLSLDKTKNLDGILAFRMMLIYARDKKFTLAEKEYVEKAVKDKGSKVNTSTLFKGLIEEELKEEKEVAISPYIKLIKNELEKLGLNLKLSVGMSKTKIDIAIEDPADPNFFILGILSDDISVLANPTARDRELMKVDTLKGRGWNIERSFLFDWIERPEVCALKIREKVLELSAKRKRGEIITIPKEEPFKIERESIEESAKRDFGFKKYESYDSESFSFNENTGLTDSLRGLLILDIVKLEAPIHKKLVKERVLEVLKEHKVDLDNGEEATLDSAIDLYKNQEDGYLLNPDKPQVFVRERIGRKKEKSIEYISNQELNKSLELCLQHAGAIKREELLKIAAKSLGFHRGKACEELKDKLGVLLQAIEEDGLATLSNDLLSLSNQKFVNC